jgi:hypothetical protein
VAAAVDWRNFAGHLAVRAARDSLASSLLAALFESGLISAVERVIGISRIPVEADVIAIAAESIYRLADLWHGSHRLWSSPVTNAVQSPRCGTT